MLQRPDQLLSNTGSPDRWTVGGGATLFGWAQWVGDVVIGLALIAIGVFIMRFTKRNSDRRLGRWIWLVVAFPFLYGLVRFAAVGGAWWPTQGLPAFLQILAAISALVAVAVLLSRFHMVSRESSRLDAVSAAPPVAKGDAGCEREPVVADPSPAARPLAAIEQALAERDEELEQVLYSVSHDLKAPLVTILGFAGVLADELGPKPPPALADPLSRIQRAARRMTRLIDGLIEVSRVGRTPVHAVELSGLSVVRELQAGRARDLAAQQISLTVVEPLPQVRADPGRLRIALDNLVSNAIQFGCTTPPARIEIGGDELATESRLYVRDFGPGVPKEHHERIFQLFQRLDPRGDAPGVGLTMVRRIMKLHRGRAWVDDTPGHGLTAWLEFPKEQVRSHDFTRTR